MFCATGLAPVPKGPPVDSKTHTFPPTRPSLSRSSSPGQADLRQRPLQPTDRLRFFRQTPAQPAAHTARLNQRNPVRLTPVPGMDHAMAPRKGIQDSEAWKRVSTTAKGLTPLEVLRRVESESRDGKGLPSGGPAGPGREPPRDELLFGLRVGYLIDVRGKSGKPIDPAPIADLIKLRLQPPGGSGPQGATPTLADDQTATFAIGIAQALFARGFPPQQVHEALRGVTDLIERMPHAPDGKNDPQFQAWRKARHANCKDAFCDALLPAGLRPTAELRQSGQDLQASDHEVHTLRRLVQEREQSIESLKQVNAQVESTLAAKEKEFQQALQKLARDAEGSGSQAQQARQQAQAARQEVVQLEQQCTELQTLNASLQQQNTALQSELAALRKQLEERETGHTAQLKELEGQAIRLQEELARGRTTATRLSEELAALKQSSHHERSDLLRQITELETAGKEKDLSLETLKKVKGELTQQLEASKAAEAGAREALRIARQEHAATMANQKLDFEQQLQQKERLIIELRKQVQDLTAGLSRVESERNQANLARQAAEITVAQQAAQLKDAQQEAERSIAALREENATLRRHAVESSTTLRSLNATIRAQGDRIHDLESQVQARESHIGRQARKIEQLTAEVESLVRARNQGEANVATLRSEVSLQASQLEDQASTIQSLTQQLAHIRLENEARQAVLKAPPSISAEDDDPPAAETVPEGAAPAALRNPAQDLPPATAAAEAEEDPLDAMLEKLDWDYKELSAALESLGEDLEVLIMKRERHALLGHLTISGTSLPDRKSAALPEDEDQNQIALFQQVHSVNRHKRLEALEKVVPILRTRLEELRSDIDELSDELFDIDDPAIVEKPDGPGDEDTPSALLGLDSGPEESDPSRA